MRCLVTGGGGFIGSNLALELEKKGHDVVVLDDFSAGSRKNLTSFSGGVLDVDCSRPFKTEGNFDAIFHQAAITDPRAPDDDETIRNNIEGFKLIIALARSQGAKLVYASSASLYGHGAAPQQEDQDPDILSAYARSKLMMDQMAAEFAKAMHIVGLRYFNVFGPNEAHKGRPASMIYHLTKQMRAGKRPKLFYDGTQKRDHIYVKDCVQANLCALDAPSGVYNVGTGVATSFNDVVKYINKALGTQFEPEYIENPYKGTYQDHTQADISRAEEMLGFTAAYTTEQGILDYVPQLIF